MPLVEARSYDKNNYPFLYNYMNCYLLSTREEFKLLVYLLQRRSHFWVFCPADLHQLYVLWWGCTVTHWRTQQWWRVLQLVNYFWDGQRHRKDKSWDKCKVFKLKYWTTLYYDKSHFLWGFIFAIICKSETLRL